MVTVKVISVLFKSIYKPANVGCQFQLMVIVTKMKGFT